MESPHSVKRARQNHYFVNLAEILQPRKECYLLLWRLGTA